MCRGLGLCLLSVPVHAFCHGSRQIGQNAAVVVVFDVIQFSGAQLKRFEFSPLAVGSTPALRSLDYKTTGSSAGIAVDFIIDDLLALSRSHLTPVHVLLQSAQTCFPWLGRLDNL